MKVINTKVHGALDYMTGGLLVAAPWLLGFYKGGGETAVPVFLGVLTIIYSLATDYEMGIIKGLSMKTHLVIDVFSGILLAASPWLFNFYETTYLPHLLIGIMEIVIAALSSSVAYQGHGNVLKMN